MHPSFMQLPKGNTMTSSTRSSHSAGSAGSATLEKHTGPARENKGDDVSMPWTLEAIHLLYKKPLLDLVYQAATVHRQHHHNDVQLCTLLSIKTGGCLEDCKYCSQSIHNNADIETHPFMEVEPVLEEARRAKAAGSTRFCMGAAWPKVLDGNALDRVCDMIRGVSDMGLEACVTLGKLNDEQAIRLKEAGLTAYNHNLDTSEEYYSQIISTRTYQDRLDTIESASKAGLSVCCGGILGLGESETDRVKLLHTLAHLDPQPESVPINMLVPVAGTPLAQHKTLSVFEWIRCIAVARILMPKAMVRLSAGRLTLSEEAQAMAFMAGANAIFTGDTLLTTPNPSQDHDLALLDTLGLTPRESYQ